MIPEHLRALVVILVVGVTTFAVAARFLDHIGVIREDFVRCRNLWIAVTLVVFLSHSYWLYCLLCAAILLGRTARKVPVVALYCTLIAAAPPFRVPIPGFGPIDHFFEMDHVRMLNLSLLLPAAIAIIRDPAAPSKRLPVVDFLVGSFLLWLFIVQAFHDSIVGTARSGFYLLLDIALPYFVVSRSICSIYDVRLAATMLTVVGTIVSMLSFFEFARFWLLYESLRSALGLPLGLPMYLLRGEDLRANVSYGNAIVLGFSIMVALAMFLTVRPKIPSKWLGWLAIGVFMAGFVGSLSRGPWVGAAIMLVAFSLAGPAMLKRALKVLAVTFVAFGLVVLSPLRNVVIPYLPFVGTVETGSIDYRQQLIDVSFQVLEQNLWFGDFFYLRNPLMEQMRQGQGIIDVVNTYLQIALPYGLIGLAMFLTPFLIVTIKLYRLRNSLPTEDHKTVARALFACQVGVLVTIATVSSIGVLPTLYWVLLAIGTGFLANSIHDSAENARHSLALVREERPRRQKTSRRRSLKAQNS